MPLPYLIGEEVFNFLSYLNYGYTVADKGGGGRRREVARAC